MSITSLHVSEVDSALARNRAQLPPLVRVERGNDTQQMGHLVGLVYNKSCVGLYYEKHDISTLAGKRKVPQRKALALCRSVGVECS